MFSAALENHPTEILHDQKGVTPLSQHSIPIKRVLLQSRRPNICHGSRNDPHMCPSRPLKTLSAAWQTARATSQVTAAQRTGAQPQGMAQGRYPHPRLVAARAHRRGTHSSTGHPRRCRRPRPHPLPLPRRLHQHWLEVR